MSTYTDTADQAPESWVRNGVFPPFVALPIHQLQERLAEKYGYTQVCEAIILSLAAENEARMYAMIAAKRNIDDTAQRLNRDLHRLRQEQITAEIVELSTVEGTLVSWLATAPFLTARAATSTSAVIRSTASAPVAPQS
ncbi:hypothetical protein WL93_00065 [Burkholderia diffusa]|uniref:F0F1 ATP synthase subunit gamma n=1 Tax=Burkholderia diffusa TaxID=488732 RepID=UPI0007548405|nr:F0F1 ATP synthase subunit gamma [Burkholderia diffusa]KWF95444.1 hypothetical protein WL93_00065 [Burkholderia diffusa]